MKTLEFTKEDISFPGNISGNSPEKENEVWNEKIITQPRFSRNSLKMAALGAGVITGGIIGTVRRERIINRVGLAALFGTGLMLISDIFYDYLETEK